MSIVQKLKATIRHTLQYCWEERVRFLIAVACIIFFAILGIVESSFIRTKTVQGSIGIPNQSLIERENREANENQANVDIFILPDCVHCHHQLEFIQNSKIEAKYPELNFRVFNLQEDKNRSILRERVIRYNIDGNRIGTPLTFFGSRYIMGFNANQLLEELDNYAAQVQEALRSRPITIVPAANFMEDEASDSSVAIPPTNTSKTNEVQPPTTPSSHAQTTQSNNSMVNQPIKTRNSTTGQNEATQELPQR